MNAYCDLRDKNLYVYLSGEIDESNIKIVKKVLEDGITKKPAKVILDLTNLIFMDSTTVGTIIFFYKKLKLINVELFARGLKKQAEKIFQTSGLFNIIKII